MDPWQLFHDDNLTMFGGGLSGMLLTREGSLLAWNTTDKDSIWRSTDQAHSWTRVGPNADWSAAPAPGPAVILEPESGDLFAYYGGLARSRDDGQTWQPLGAATLRNVVNIMVRDANTIFVVRDNGKSVSRSDDGGEVFSPITTDVFLSSSGEGTFIVDRYDTLYFFDGDFERIFLHDPRIYTTNVPGESDLGEVVSLPDGTLLAGGAYGVQRSVDYGDTWTKIAGSPGGLTRWTLDSQQRLWAQRAADLLVSGDMGSTWQVVGPPHGRAEVLVGPFVTLPSGEVLVSQPGFGAYFHLRSALEIELMTALPGPEIRPGTCYDGALDGDETQIDCGGVCRVCLPPPP